MNVKQIEAKDTYHLRSVVLRPGLPLNECEFHKDFDEHTFHLGAFVDDKLASVASFYFIKNDKIENNYQYQLRGMATLEDFRGQGLSSALLRMAFPIIKNNHVDLLWCNARTNAVGFYENVGFKKIKEYSSKLSISDTEETKFVVMEKHF